MCIKASTTSPDVDVIARSVGVVTKLLQRACSLGGSKWMKKLSPQTLLSSGMSKRSCCGHK